MSNSYTRFSFAIPLVNDEQVGWARGAERFLKLAAEVDYERDELFMVDGEDEEYRFLSAAMILNADGTTRLMALRVKRANEAYRTLLDECDDYALSYDAEVDRDGLWIHADESGTPEHVIPLIQAYLQKFDPEGGHGFEWADYSDRPQLDSFGGGAVWVTANDAEWNSGSRWLADKTINHHRKEAS